MLISKQITVYAIKCDVCGKLYEYIVNEDGDRNSWSSDTTWFEDKILESHGWGYGNDNEHYCPKHWEWKMTRKEDKNSKK